MTTRLGQALVYAFSYETHGGNPSFVIATSGQRPDLETECRARSKNLGCEFTHLHLSQESSCADVRFYVESGALSFCGHGALAAAAWAVNAGMAQENMLLDYGSGSLSLRTDGGGERIGFVEQAGQVKEVHIDEPVLASLRAALGLPFLQPESVKVWTGGRQRMKALVSLPSLDLMQGLNIDPEARDSWCQQLGVTGIYPYFQVGPGRIVARHFPLRAGTIEDLATGNIASTLGQHLSGSYAQSLIIEQGGASCSASRLQVQPYETNWFISGYCRFESI